jgi:predicted transcriptional regulator
MILLLCQQQNNFGGKMKEIKIQLPEKEDLDEAIDEALVGLLKFFLDSEAKSKIYLYLRKKGASTSQQIAKGANLYPSSTREALAGMTKSGIVTRQKLETEGTGKKPYVYEAISATELFKSKISGIESKLNELLNLDNYLKGGKTLKHPKVPYRVRIEKVIDEEGVEQVIIESEGGEEVKET